MDWYRLSTGILVCYGLIDSFFFAWSDLGSITKLGVRLSILFITVFGLWCHRPWAWVWAMWFSLLFGTLEIGSLLVSILFGYNIDQTIRGVPNIARFWIAPGLLVVVFMISFIVRMRKKV